ncbi:MAG: SWIM zinc finger family protein [Myxococcota bacterium]
MSIDEAFVDSAAPNAAALTKARKLARGGKLLARHQDADGTLIFGECAGSGKQAYRPSADFQDPSNPVYRCTCPSRQFPCKHTLALLYAFASGEAFTVADVPEDIAAKRAKQVARAENRKARAAKPKKVNKRALAKKIDAQLDGLATLETLLHDLMRSGLGAITAKTAAVLEKQAKQLGDAYLPGAQYAVRQLAGALGADENPEAAYDHAIAQLLRIATLCKRGVTYLEARKADPELTPDTRTPIAAWLGHAWQLSELRALELFEENAELVQLYFRAYDDLARRERVELGVWLNLKSGALQQTLNYRPHRAERFMKEASSFHHVRQTPCLYRYPGETLPRVRWDEASERPLDPRDLATLRSHALDLSAAIKAAKGRLKDPLYETAFALVRYDQLGRVGDATVLQSGDERIVLNDDAGCDPMETVALLELVDGALHRNQVALLAFRPQAGAHSLHAKPLTLISEAQIVRLAL